MKHRVQKTDAIYQLLTFILLASMSMPVAADDFHADSATVSLLTCSGGREVYEQYGHTAIRFNNNRGTDITFNYGVFDFNTPDFVYRFIKGETDYQLGIEPFEYFRSSYARRGSEVREQVLNLTSDEKVRLFQSLCVNFQPENRIYRYNFFYDNCTLRARDMIEGPSSSPRSPNSQASASSPSSRTPASATSRHGSSTPRNSAVRTAMSRS